jgi:hypothetical protein
MPRVFSIGLLLAAAGPMAACSTAPSAPSSPGTPSSTAVVRSSASPVGSPRPSPPASFPVFPGASPAPLPADDTGVAARWTTGTLGSAAYDFYQRELPTAGYRILGLFPGGGGAVIRFVAADVSWQVEIIEVNDRTQVSLRTDRP